MKERERRERDTVKNERLNEKTQREKERERDRALASVSKRERERQKKKEKSQSQREGEKVRKKNKTNMLGTYYATKWNETSHPKSVHVYLLFHKQIPAIQSKNVIIPVMFFANVS